METTLVRIPEGRVDEYDTELREAADIIKRGGLVAFPTETVYGLGASALLQEGAQKIYNAKGRPSDNPLIIHVSSVDDFEKWCEIDNPEGFRRLAENFLPGPITIIQKKKKIIPDTVTAGLDTVAVRFPSHPVARRLIELSGVPIAAPSANISGSPSPTDVAHVIKDLWGKVDLIIDGGECDVGLESTIVMLREGELTLLRPGGVTLEELRALFGDVKVDRAVLNKLGEGEKPLAPGMKYRHYAPKAPVTALVGNDEKILSFFAESVKSEKVGVICYREDLEPLGLCEESLPRQVRVLGSRSDSAEMAHRLFSALRAFDSLDGLEIIYTRLPDKSDLGLALVNRLMKACGYSIKEL